MASKKITQLTDLTAPALTDLLAAVADPGGSPITKKLTLANLKALIAPSPVVASYTIDTSQTIASATSTVINYDRLVQDTHSRVTTGASWRFTAAVAGYYVTAATVQLTSPASWTTGKTARLYLFKNNGSTVDGTGILGTYNSYGTASFVQLGGTRIVYLAVGDYLELRVIQDTGSSVATYAGAGGQFSHVSIWKVGS